MDRQTLVTSIKTLCERHKVKFVDDVKVGRSVLILVVSENAIGLLTEWLTAMQVEFTTPMMMTDAIGTYVTIDEI